MAWMWRYQDGAGSSLDPAAAPGAETFPSQSDAESWLGENWQELLHAGVEQVVLLDGERAVYGPMSLRPAD